MRRALLCLAVASVLLGCPQEIRPLIDGGVGADSGEPSDSGFSDTGALDTGALDADTPDADPPDAGPGDTGAADAGPQPDGGFTPNQPCEPVVLGCLDPALESVLSVPDEVSWTDALAMVGFNQTIQIRGLDVGAGVRVPAAVTLHGCEGARIIGAVAFEGIGGTIEGFEVLGSIVANQTGVYLVRRNRFVGGSSTEPGVSARSVDALVSASVAVVVEQNLFEDRTIGVWVATRYDTMQHQVTAQVHDNVFNGCETGISVSENGLVGHIEAEITHNTFYAFNDAIRLEALELPTPLTANLFVNGGRAVAGTSAFQLQVALLDDVVTPSQSGLYSGTFATGAAAFVDAAAGDFRLTAASDAVDLVGNAPSGLDYLGCPRPVGLFGSVALGDVGALEAQP
ncbi:MAG: hypothetical protein KC933_28295 [Myxococcales bacterium]|nr:hypothetical protein [Myxococcales bacterium]